MIEGSNLLRSAEKARSLAERIFSQYTQTTESLKWLKDNSQEFNTRIASFDWVVAKLNEALSNPTSANKLYGQEINELAKLIEHIPSLTEAAAETNSKFTHNSPALRAYFQGKREFRWADEEFDPNRPAKSATGIFLEGYGRYIGLRLSREPEQIANIQKAFVYAFEAVLLVEQPNSELLGDITEWMKADVNCFSKSIQALL